jgi:hypothetical protein
MEFYVDEQIGRRDWSLPRPRQSAVSSLPPHIDHKISMQWFLAPTPTRGEPHAGPFMADLDAHVKGITVDHCCAEAVRFTEYLQSRWAVEPNWLRFWFSAGSGLHLAIPASLFGTPVSPHLTGAFKVWARRIKDTLGLFTIDAPTAHATLDWWEPHLVRLIGGVPTTLTDPNEWNKRVKGNSLYAERRLFRCEGVKHPRTGLYKTRVAYSDILRGEVHLRALAQRRALVGAEPEPPPHLPLVIYVQALLEQREEESTRRQQRAAHQIYLSEQHDSAAQSPVIPRDAPAPLCMRRLLTTPPSQGNTNNARITLATYWRMKGIAEDTAVLLLRQWLRQTPCHPDKDQERAASAQTTVRTVYRYPSRYRFGIDYIAALGVIAPDECAPCPLRAQCWITDRIDHHDQPGV